LQELLKSGDKEIFIERSQQPIGIGYRMIMRWYNKREDATANFVDLMLIERMKISDALKEMVSWAKNNGDE
jgi:hypothetical protein